MKGVLLDTSCWIYHFSGGSDKIVDAVLNSDIAVTNDVILTELIPFIRNTGKMEIVKSLEALPVIPLNIDWGLIRRMQFDNLRNGINKVGIPDLIILQQVIENKLDFYSLDKHFKMMREIFEFKLILP